MTTRNHPHALMSSSQEWAGPSTAGWPLAAGEARRLVIGPGPRWLKVRDGRVWLTPSADGRAGSEDIWLQASEFTWLDSGAEVVLEGWGAASFELLVPPQVCGGRVVTPWGLRLTQALRRGLAAAQVSRPAAWASS